MARQFPAKKGQQPVDQPPTDQDAEDQAEAPETPGETPDAEDLAEGPESQFAGDDAESPAEDQAEGGDESDDAGKGVPKFLTDDAPNVTPEEQKQYDTVVTLAMKMIFNPQAIGVLVQKLRAGQANISKEIGQTTANIMQSVRATVMQQGKTIGDDVLYAAGQEVIGDLCDVAVGAGIMPQSKVQPVAQAALFEGMRAWGANMMRSGAVTPDMQKQAQDDLKAHGIQQVTPPQSAQPQAAPQPQGATSPAPGGQPTGGIVNQAGA